MADNFPWSSSLNTFADVFSEPSPPNSSRTALKEPIVHSENLYHAHLGSQNDENSSIREPLREINDNNISPDCSTATAWGRSLKSMPPFGEKQIDNRLIHNSKTLPDLKAPLAYRHRKNKATNSGRKGMFEKLTFSLGLNGFFWLKLMFLLQWSDRTIWYTVI